MLRESELNYILILFLYSHVFEQVETNSIQIWKYGMYYLVMEYDNKPGLPPPFIVLHHMFTIIRYIFKKKKQFDKRKLSNSFHRVGAFPLYKEMFVHR